MYIILICDGGFLSINLELSGTVAGLTPCYQDGGGVKCWSVGHLYNAGGVGMYTGVICAPEEGCRERERESGSDGTKLIFTLDFRANQTKMFI